VVVSAPEALGHYRVAFDQADGPTEKGFSVNASPDESRLDPVSPSELTAVLGEGTFAVARSLDELREVREDVRIGRELFPWLMLLLIVLFTLEHFLANRFYKKPEAAMRDSPRASHSRPFQVELESGAHRG
jgi:hypothetical protein